MKINPFRPVEQNPYKRQMNTVERHQAAVKTDKVEISPEAKEMQQIPSIVKEREAKVAEIKKQVQNGTYEVNAKDIAKGIAEFYKL
ncbi:flagellar biosynthesis anti-sigma factor FlgM [Bacillus sp. FJAT-50079]|uniref:flagellar biosynthesis anti-sigma factor FlgM n=1 Tax=Bacillus sp. FJAT-50079 TaxID=2833577 RepID=UPI001BC8F26F|nr:flagellar biosynthesis anti-sigma factor FlgM [Bacillus sp. FJAT-50079]MBS4208278.1 flagellar biosynthesis anti-sigma factor FlgM [Bacillus sp. FJAT-50079]